MGRYVRERWGADPSATKDATRRRTPPPPTTPAPRSEPEIESRPAASRADRAAGAAQAAAGWDRASGDEVWGAEPDVHAVEDLESEIDPTTPPSGIDLRGTVSRERVGEPPRTSP
ncbi:hypothetical protein HF519_17930, partial [Pseudonocardia bannensis]|nr:hypothetical protein [Pseudonocardia bannensis]